MHETSAFPCVPFGKINSFGECGPPYQVGQAARQVPDADLLVEIMPIETGEAAVYRLSRLIVDSVMTAHTFALVVLFQFWYILP